MQVANEATVTADAPLSPPLSTRTSTLQNLWKSLCQWGLRTPLTALAAYCLVSVYLQENYPFSHFPMYSNPSPERPYYMVADGEGKPLPIAALTGVTCPKIGKIYRTECQEVADKHDLKKDHLPAEHKQAIGLKMFSYLRKEAASRNQTMPEQLQLVRMEISYQDGKIVETPEIIAKETAAPPVRP